MNWTREKPTAPGLYWYKEKDGDVYFIELSECAGIEYLITDTSCTVDEIIEWWSVRYFGAIT